MASANVIKVKGDPIEDDQLTASAATILPGHLVQVHIGTGRQLENHDVASGNAKALFALNRDEKGQNPSGADGTTYAIGDRVKTASFGRGMRLRAMIASGETVTGIEPLESDGTGRLQVQAVAAATTELERSSIVAWSLEDSGGALAADTLLEVEVA